MLHTGQQPPTHKGEIMNPPTAVEENLITISHQQLGMDAVCSLSRRVLRYGINCSFSSMYAKACSSTEPRQPPAHAWYMYSNVSHTIESFLMARDGGDAPAALCFNYERWLRLNADMTKQTRKGLWTVWNFTVFCFHLSENVIRSLSGYWQM